MTGFFPETLNHYWVPRDIRKSPMLTSSRSSWEAARTAALECASERWTPALVPGLSTASVDRRVLTLQAPNRMGFGFRVSGV